MAWRRCRASRGAWLGGEEEEVKAELLSSAEGRGVAGDGCYGERRRWWCSAVGEGARERREEPRESEREQGGGVASSGASSEEGRAGRQASRWRGAVARARAGHTPLPLSRTKTTEEGGGLGRLLAGPASWLGRTVEEPR